MIDEASLIMSSNIMCHLVSRGGINLVEWEEYKGKRILLLGTIRK